MHAADAVGSRRSSRSPARRAATAAGGDRPAASVPLPRAERFRGVVWAKTGGYVIVEMVADANDGEETGRATSSTCTATRSSICACKACIAARSERPPA